MKDTDVKNAGKRAGAIRDGALIDVGGAAAEAGFDNPVALTRAVWDGHVRARDGADRRDEEERLGEILWILRVAVERAASRTGGCGDDALPFSLWVQDGDRRERVRLKAAFGPGDDGEPVITIMTTDEG